MLQHQPRQDSMKIRPMFSPWTSGLSAMFSNSCRSYWAADLS